MATFVGTCVGLPARFLDEYDDTAREICYRTFLRYVGKDVVAEFGRNPPLRQDWHVSFSKGRWRGKPAVCLMHSSIHHIWYV